MAGYGNTPEEEDKDPFEAWPAPLAAPVAVAPPAAVDAPAAQAPRARPDASYSRTALLQKMQDIDNKYALANEVGHNIANAFTRKPVQWADNRELFAKQRAEMATEEARAKTLADADPLSASSGAYREMVRKALPKVAEQMGPMFERLTPAKGAQVMPFLNKQWELEKQKQDRVNKVGDTADERRWKEGQSDLDRASRERAATNSAGAKAGQNTITNAAEMRKELMTSPVTKAYQESAISWGKIQQVAKDPSAAGDLALIFNFMKTLDPGSTVREGEFANAQNAGGVDDKVRAAWNNAMSGQRLTPEQRTDFLKRAGEAFKEHEGRYKQLASQFEGAASRAGLNPRDVVFDLSGGPAAGEASMGKYFQDANGDWHVRE